MSTCSYQQQPVQERLERGSPVRIHGLQRHTELNGLTGTVEDFDLGTWSVNLDDGGTKHVKPSNLELLAPEARLNPHQQYHQHLARLDQTDKLATVRKRQSTPRDWGFPHPSSEASLDDVTVTWQRMASPGKEVGSTSSLKRASALDAELAVCSTALQMLQGRTRTTGDVASLRADCMQLSLRVQQLAAHALESGCSRGVPGAMDVFEKANAIIEQLAIAMRATTHEDCAHRAGPVEDFANANRKRPDATVSVSQWALPRLAMPKLASLQQIWSPRWSSSTPASPQMQASRKPIAPQHQLEQAVEEKSNAELRNENETLQKKVVALENKVIFLRGYIQTLQCAKVREQDAVLNFHHLLLDDTEEPISPSEVQLLRAKVDALKKLIRDKDNLAPVALQLIQQGDGKELQLAKGDEVQVIEAFESNSEHFARLHVGERGIVAEIDADGDALVRFPGYGRLQCIYKKDFDKLHCQEKEDEFRHEHRELQAAVVETENADPIKGDGENEGDCSNEHQELQAKLEEELAGLQAEHAEYGRKLAEERDQATVAAERSAQHPEEIVRLQAEHTEFVRKLTKEIDQEYIRILAEKTEQATVAAVAESSARHQDELTRLNAEHADYVSKLANKKDDQATAIAERSAQHQEELVRLKTEHADYVRKHLEEKDQATVAAVAERSAQHQEELDRLQDNHADYIRKLAEEREQEKDAAVFERSAQHQEELAGLKAEHADYVRKLVEEKDQATGAAVADRSAQHQEELVGLKAEHAANVRKLAEERDQAIVIAAAVQSEQFQEEMAGLKAEHACQLTEQAEQAAAEGGEPAPTQQSSSSANALPAEHSDDEGVDADLVPVRLALKARPHGEKAQIAGMDIGWDNRLDLDKVDGEFIMDRSLMPGTYEYKFIVDGEWMVDHHLPTTKCENGHDNNLLVVEPRRGTSNRSMLL